MGIFYLITATELQAITELLTKITSPGDDEYSMEDVQEIAYFLEVLKPLHTETVLRILETHKK